MVGHTAADSSADSTPNAIQAQVACQPSATMPLAIRPGMAMPSPGPQKMMPPNAAWPSSVSRCRHQPAVNTNTSALAMPAAKRSMNHAGWPCSTPIPAVSRIVAISPMRISRAASPRTAMQANAPMK